MTLERRRLGHSIVLMSSGCLRYRWCGLQMASRASLRLQRTNAYAIPRVESEDEMKRRLGMEGRVIGHKYIPR